jgi:hypothetical protein
LGQGNVSTGFLLAESGYFTCFHAETVGAAWGFDQLIVYVILIVRDVLIGTGNQSVDHHEHFVSFEIIKISFVSTKVFVLFVKVITSILISVI